MASSILNVLNEQAGRWGVGGRGAQKPWPIVLILLGQSSYVYLLIPVVCKNANKQNGEHKTNLLSQ